MKARIVLVGALMFFGLSAAAFAQGNFDTGSTPVTAVVRSGHTERTGDITFTQTSGTTIAGTITISYGVPITVPFTAVAVTGTGALAAATVNVTASNNAAGRLVINVPPGGVATNTLRVSGVRVGISGSGLTVLDAQLSSTGNTITTGQLAPRVISAVAPGIASVTTDPEEGIRISSVTGVVTNSPSLILVEEGFLNAFGEMPTPTNSQTTSTLVRIRLSAVPPPDVTLTFAATATSDGTAAWQTADCDDGAVDGTTVSFDSDSDMPAEVCYRLTANNDPTLVETMSISVTATAVTDDLPLGAAAITVTATFAPIGTAFDDGDVILDPIPRYAAEEVGPTLLLSIVGANTTLLIPFATTVTGANYNTGIAISNSTSDPGSTLMGVEGAVPQTGTITFHFYPGLPSTAAKFAYTTVAGSPGSGLNASGGLPSGSTYTVLLSQLLSAAGQPADFSGYIFAITNFTNAHCLYVVSNFTSFSQGSLALVVNNNRTGTLLADPNGEGLDN